MDRDHFLMSSSGKNEHKINLDSFLLDVTVRLPRNKNSY